MEQIVFVTVVSLAAALVSVLGAFVVMTNLAIQPRVVSALLGIAAGIMLSLTCFSLIAPGLAEQKTVAVLLGIVLGAGCLYAVDRMVPHEHQQASTQFHVQSSALRWIVIAALIHNIPEGLAIGVGLSGKGAQAGMPLVLGIGFQNILEGVVMAIALKHIGVRAVRLCLFVLVTSLIQPVMALCGNGLTVLYSQSLYFMLAFAAGGMLFVVSSEMVPESHTQGNERFATIGIIVGFIVMMGMNALM